jgi:uncharacterized glyoxalase superfamily protein PhnB
MTDNLPAPQVWPSLRARDPLALIDFLVGAFGFQKTAVYADGTTVHHAELAWPPGGGIMLGSAPAGETNSPLAPGVFSAYAVIDDPDALFDRATAAGAVVVKAPYDTDYGSRQFIVDDPEGNQWSFGTWRGEPRPRSGGVVG